MLPLADVIDIDKEKERLERELAKARGEIDKLDKKLGNKGFLAKAPEHVVEEQHERKRDAESSETRLVAALARF